MTVHYDDPPDYSISEDPPWPTDTDAPHPIIEALRIVESGALNQTPEPEPERELAWDPIDLAPILLGEITTETPTILHRTDNKPLIYPGKHHDIHGEPGQGKSWICLAAAIDVINQGHAAIWVDWEDTPAAFVTRARALGLPDAIIGDPTALAFIRPTGPLGVFDIDALLEHATRIDAQLIIFDAFVDALGYQGLEENSTTDAITWLSLAARPFNTAGIATIVADHVTKDPATRTRGAVGGSGKLRFIDGVSYNLKTTTPFDRTTPGISNLIIVKDRHGHVGTQGQTVAKITFTPSDNGAALDLVISPPGDNTDEEGRFLPTHLMERISRHLEQLPDGAHVSKTSIARDVKGKDAHLLTAVDRLIEHGHLTVDMSGTNAVYSLTEKYRKPSDPGPSNPTPLPDCPALPRVARQWPKESLPAMPPPTGQATIRGNTKTPETDPQLPAPPEDDEPW